MASTPSSDDEFSDSGDSDFIPNQSLTNPGLNAGLGLDLSRTPTTSDTLLSPNVQNDEAKGDGSKCHRIGPCSAGHGLEFHSRIYPSPSRSSRRRSSRSSESTCTRGFGTPDRTINSRRSLNHGFDQEARLTTVNEPGPGLAEMRTRPEVVVEDLPSSFIRPIQQRVPTSDYSSDDDFTSTSPKIELGCGSPRLKAFEGRSWIKSPRTGYTYVNSPTYRNSWTPDRETPMPHMARLSLYDYNDGEVAFVRPKRLFASEETSFASQHAEFSADEDDFELLHTPRRWQSNVCSLFLTLITVFSFLCQKALYLRKTGYTQIVTLMSFCWKNSQEAEGSESNIPSDQELTARSESAQPWREKIKLLLQSALQFVLYFPHKFANVVKNLWSPTTAIPRMFKTANSDDEDDEQETIEFTNQSLNSPISSYLTRLWNLITFQDLSGNECRRRRSYRQGTRRSLRQRGIQPENIEDNVLHKKRRRPIRTQSGNINEDEDVSALETTNNPMSNFSSDDEDDTEELDGRENSKNTSIFSYLAGFWYFFTFRNLPGRRRRRRPHREGSRKSLRQRGIHPDNIGESPVSRKRRNPAKVLSDNFNISEDEEAMSSVETTDRPMSKFYSWASNINIWQQTGQLPSPNLPDSVEILSSSKGLSRKLCTWLFIILLALLLLPILLQILVGQEQDLEIGSQVYFAYSNTTENIKTVLDLSSRIIKRGLEKASSWYPMSWDHYHVEWNGVGSVWTLISRFNNFVFEVFSSLVESLKHVFSIFVNLVWTTIASIVSLSYSQGATSDPITGKILDDPSFAKGIQQLVQQIVHEEQTKQSVELNKAVNEFLEKHSKFDRLLADQHRLGNQLETLQASLETQFSVQDLERVKLNLASRKERFSQHMEKQTSVVQELTEKIRQLESQIESLQTHIRTCCLNASYIEELVMTQFSVLTNNCEVKMNQSLSTVREELDKLVKIGRLNLNEEILLTTENKIKQIQAEEVEQATQSILQDVLARIHLHNLSNSSGQSGFDRRDIEVLIQSAIATYDADKTGLFDFALESAGGSVVSTRCTESYLRREATYTLFGVPLWWQSNNPRVAIQPGVNPGECWAFKGSEGFLVVQLSTPMTPTRFSMEHIPKSMSPSGKIDSAPKEFEVYGYVESDQEPNPALLGRFTYEIDNNPIQFFTVQNPSDKLFRFVELKIISNHGNINYTCLYRFRVHGAR